VGGRRFPRGTAHRAAAVRRNCWDERGPCHFSIYSLLVLLRVELFLDDLTGRADWQQMVVRFRESGFENLRTFITLDYIKGLPFKIGVASLVGGLFGAIGGGLGRSRRLGWVERV
jgi:hypothetical protein